MHRNGKLIIICAAAALIIIGVVVLSYISGKGVGSRFFAGDVNQSEATQDKATPTPDKAVPTPEPVNIVEDQANSTAGGKEDVAQDDANAQKEINKIKVKAVYLTGTSAGSTKALDRTIDLINKTELNAVVVDVKEGGRVNYKSSVPDVVKYGLYNKFYDPDKLIKKLHDNNIYVIARIVTFRDDGLARKRADLAVKRVDGTIWTEGKLGAWTNPYMEDVWQYNIDIAKEAISKGFDEIQFDYVRFPTAKKKEVNYGSNLPSKVDAIDSFLAAAKKELHDGIGIPVSADVFGIIAESKSDGEAIGQDLEKVGMDVDAISPMVYPSHYAKGQQVNGVVFPKPDMDPYGVVYQTLVKAKNRISAVTGYSATVRPYLQNFTATWLKKGDYIKYGPEQVRQQIKAVYDAGYEEWILWNPSNVYAEAIFEKE